MLGGWIIFFLAKTNMSTLFYYFNLCPYHLPLFWRCGETSFKEENVLSKVIAQKKKKNWHRFQAH